MLYFSEAFCLHRTYKNTVSCLNEKQRITLHKDGNMLQTNMNKKMENIICMDSYFHKILLIWSFRKANHIASRGDFMQVFPGLVNCKSKYILE